MRLPLCLCFLAALLPAACDAAVIRGSVLENQTGKPLSRTELKLEPVAGTPGAVQSTRTSLTGAFAFDSLPAGAYVLKAARAGFLPIEYGQKRWNSAAKPILLEADASPFVTIRMLRYSAVMGTVMDENYVGLPDYDVVAYRATSPPQLAGQGRTDDRGMFRISGLEPGAYVVRSAGKQYDLDSYLPTFSRETGRLEEARAVDLLPEQELGFADVRPMPGRLYSLTVLLSPPPLEPTTIFLASDMGRKIMPGPAAQFSGLPPGEYEAYAETKSDTGRLGEPAGYQRFNLGRDMSVTVRMEPGSQIAVTGAPSGESGKLWLRHKDLAGAGPPISVPVTNGRAAVPLGRWEVLLEPPAGYYVASFGNAFGQPARSRPDGWNEYMARQILGRFALSSGPAEIQGIVQSRGDPVSGVVVFLEPYDPATRKRDGDLRSVRTDARGRYRLSNLAPGTYRLLSTFEYLAPEAEVLDIANAQPFIVDAHSQAGKDLELYVLP